MEPRHPLEPKLHEDLRAALNAGLRNQDFFVWIDVRPSGVSNDFARLDHMVEETDRWLATLDPDVVRPSEDRRAAVRFDDPAAEVKIEALPKKREARGQRAKEIVGNPAPILVGWN